MATPPVAPKRVSKIRPVSSRNCFSRLPAEILDKIVSYLDASALFTVSFTDKFLCRLANENAPWAKMYVAEFCKDRKAKQKSVDEQQLVVPTAPAVVQDQPLGYWKMVYFRSVAARDSNKWKRHLRAISNYTGLPSQTERVLRNLHVTWELTVSDKSGLEAAHELSWARFSETSATLCWSGVGCLPDQRHISTLQLHGVRRVALNCPGLKKPGWRSLMAELDVETLAQNAQTIGGDRLVELRLLKPGITIGLWKGQNSVAFVMFTLHFLSLVESSTEGSWGRPYTEPVYRAPLDDIDPQYGLHGYHLHLLLHNTEQEIISGSFSQLACQRSKINNGLVQLTAVSRMDLSQHRPLSASVALPWRCEALEGTVQDCCVMSVTLLDEFRKPFWCVSSLVSMRPEKSSVCYDRDATTTETLPGYQDDPKRAGCF
ncbi:F-box only protein 15 isoform X2 [Nelusetta ayraudi]|uniref:F-box only protein 15 isoform X2 n=1 Tax=Nelusetta ayraudi TaxID=303726 RepID=UPI003F7171CD